MNITQVKMLVFENWKIIIYQSFTNKFYSMQADSSTKHIARVKPSQYIPQPLCEQMSKNTAAAILLISATPKAWKSLL